MGKNKISTNIIDELKMEVEFIGKYGFIQPIGDAYTSQGKEYKTVRLSDGKHKKLLATKADAIFLYQNNLIKNQMKKTKKVKKVQKPKSFIDELDQELEELNKKEKAKNKVDQKIEIKSRKNFINKQNKPYEQKQTGLVLTQKYNLPENLFEDYAEDKIKITKEKFRNSIVVYNFTMDPTLRVKEFNSNLRQLLISHMKKISNALGFYKCVLKVEALFYRNSDPEDSSLGLFYSGSYENPLVPYINGKNYKSVLDMMIENINEKIQKHQDKSSDHVLECITKIIINGTRYQAFAGSSYIELPEFIKNKKCCINIKNQDDKCFLYSVLAALYPAKSHSDRVSNYTPYIDKLKVDGIEFPVSVDDVSKFEQMNKIGVNVFSLDMGYDKKGDKVDKHFSILHKSTYNSEKIINLLHLENDDKEHYVLIKNLNAFVKSRNTALKVCQSANNGVISLNTTPSTGQLGTSVILSL
jgi:hypothetical protein